MPANEWPMPCKFDPEHGAFPNPPRLSQHYREQHADVWQPDPKNSEKIECPVCGMTVSMTNARRHMEGQHPSYRFKKLDDLRHPPVKDKLPAVVHRPAKVKPPELPPLTAEDVDQIVLGLVDQLAGPTGVFPVQHLPALFVWREATEVFLRSVTR